MKIKYEFNTGEITEVEVSEEIGTVIIDSRKAEHAQEERNRYHCYSLDAIDYEGLEYGTNDIEDKLSDDELRRIHYAFSKLSPTQQKRMLLLSQGKSMREIAILEDVAFNAVYESIVAARKKFLKYF